MYECIGRIGKRDCELGSGFLRNLILRIRANEFLFYSERWVQKYNTEVPEIVKEYYSYCHPFIAGQHKNNPHKTESLFCIQRLI